MKKLAILLIPFLICGCELSFNKVNSEDLIFNKTTTDTPKEDEKKEEYVDNNPVVISLYTDNVKGGLTKSDNEVTLPWIKKKDIVVFGSILTNEDELAPDYFQNIWKKYYDKYEGIENTKLGWHINFKLDDNTEIDRMIFSPKDVDDFYDYLEIYLYDSANIPIGVWYSHLLESQMTDKTIMTSMKLTAGSKYEQIISDITVSAFTYDGDDDFDSNNHYRGKSVYTVKISKQ